jgi:rhamnogalacturonyl hydrolase YesR
MEKTETGATRLRPYSENTGNENGWNCRGAVLLRPPNYPKFLRRKMEQKIRNPATMRGRHGFTLTRRGKMGTSFPHPMTHFPRPFAPAVTLLAAALAVAPRCPAQTAAPAQPTASAPAAPAPAAKIVITPPSKEVLAEYFGTWPAGTSPEEIGKRVAENFLPRQFRFETPQYARTANAPVVYPEVIAWYGAFTFAEVTKNADMQNKLIQKFAIFSTPEGAAHISPANAVDFHVFGIVPLEIYLLTKTQGYLDLGKSFADRQLASVFKPVPNSTEVTIVDGEARYWVDDLYMMPINQMQAYRATHDKVYLDRTAQMFSTYFDRLQQPDGLFYHGIGAPYYWSRGDGWVAAGVTELLRELPTDHPLFPKIFAGYQKMMAALLKYQGDDGLWKELIDHPEAWSESSGSAMFTFAFVTGVKNGWLDAKTYGPAARKAWLGLVKLIDKDGNIANVCPGTNKYTGADTTAGVQYYIGQKPLAGDALNTFNELHGNAPVLWTATALLR